MYHSVTVYLPLSSATYCSRPYAGRAVSDPGWRTTFSHPGAGSTRGPALRADILLTPAHHSHYRTGSPSVLLPALLPHTPVRTGSTLRERIVGHDLPGGFPQC